MTVYDETITVPLDCDAGAVYQCTVELWLDVDYDGWAVQTIIITVPDDDEGEEPDVECPPGQSCDFGDDGWQGSIVCANGCEVTVNDPGDNVADLTVEPIDDSSFKVTLISEQRDRRWWRTAGIFEYDGDVEDEGAQLHLVGDPPVAASGSRALEMLDHHPVVAWWPDVHPLLGCGPELPLPVGRPSGGPAD